MTDLGRDIRVRVKERGPKTEAELAEELEVSKTDIRFAAEAEDAVVVVPDRAERTYDFQLNMAETVKKFRDAGIG